ncbi:MAG: CPBP family intramembrane metalloprotease [Paracoccaceae bacterium]|nr:MAG: CPBP family intramembrane metalloprotease [Paracoccaceae bacterium]
MTGIVIAEPERRMRLRVEFILFFLAVPLGIALFLPPSAMFTALFAATAVGIGLLHLTPGFRWGELARGRVDWPAVAAFAAVTLVTALAVSWVTTGGRPLAFASMNPGLLVMILCLYPFLSALPQELVFRPLFFRRYGAVLPGGGAAAVLNAAVFSFAHLMYWSWIVAAMTFFGGLAFAWAYAQRGSFVMAVVMHAVAGQIVFALGLGMFFYSGNVDRPF